MTMHQEARRRQMHMDRVCEARRRLALARMNVQAESYIGNTETASALCADQQLPYQAQNAYEWPDSMRTQTNHSHRGPILEQSWQTQKYYDRSRDTPILGQSWQAQRCYDRSREGPLLGQSWQKMDGDIKFRENSISSRHAPVLTISCKGCPNWR